MMLVKLDENLSQTHAEFLRKLGYNCHLVTDEGLSGADDEIVWQQVCVEGRFFITLDLDFSDVRRFPPGTHPGILLLRPRSRSRQAGGSNPGQTRKSQVQSQIAGAGGNWPVIDETPEFTVVKQQGYFSCGSACGEMLLKSRGINNINQATIEQLSNAPTWPELLANALNQLQSEEGGKWVGNFVSTSSFEGLNLTGSWVAVLWESGVRIGHMVIVDGTDHDNVLIRDPWDGTKYKMTMADFLQYWNGQAVYWVR